MADVSIMPSNLRYFQWGQYDAPNPRLAAPISSSDTTITFTDPPLDEDGAVIRGDCLIGIGSADGYVESVWCPTTSISADGLTLTGAVRGVDMCGLDYTTSNTAAYAVDHDQDDPVVGQISGVNFEMMINALNGTIGSGGTNWKVGDETASDVNFVVHNDQTVKPKFYFDDSLKRWRITRGDDSGAVVDNELSGFMQLTTAERDALTTPPAGGIAVYNTTVGQTQWREGGAWVTNAAGGTVANASTTVAGKVEVATQTETENGSATGGTGASLVATPASIAARVQQSDWSYAADAEASDTYVITLTPAPAAYAAGELFHFKANTANTGAATLNVNALGALAILKNDDEVLTDGDIQAGQIVSVVHDGTQFQMVSPTAAQMSVANKDTLTDGSEVAGIHYHSWTSGTVAWDPTAATQTSQVTHGLGRTPKYIRATYYVQAAGTITFVPGGVLTYSAETGLDGIHTNYSSAGPSYASNIGAAAIVHFAAEDFQFDIRSVGATTFDFYCTAFTSQQAINILWEAY